MNAHDIMSSPVVAVSPDTSVRDVARLLIERGISGVPVLEEGRLLGVISEADLIHRFEIGTDFPSASGSWWTRLFRHDPSPAEYVKSHARHARDIMTTPPVTVGEDMPIAQIASLFERLAIRRVPVVNGVHVVGIISRADLVRALALKPGADLPPAQGDEAIRQRLLDELERQIWWRPLLASVIVADGRVHYWGMVESEDQRHAARVAAENVPGVRGVEDHRFQYEQGLESMV